MRRGKRGIPRRNAAARQLGIENASLQRYEDGDRLPSLKILLDASRLYGRPVGWFFEEADRLVLGGVFDQISPALARAASDQPVAVQEAAAELLPALARAIDRAVKVGYSPSTG